MSEPSSSYEYEFDGGEHNSYRFSTVDAVGYEVKFIPSADIFNAYSDLGVEVFEMTISVAYNPTGGRLPTDSLSASMIFAIFEDFFLPKRYAIVFICDSSDGRQRARHRKFGVWFYNNYNRTYTTDEIAKIDRTITDGDQHILLSLIMSRLNPQRTRIVDIFMQLGEEGKEPDPTR